MDSSDELGNANDILAKITYRVAEKGWSLRMTKKGRYLVERKKKELPKITLQKRNFRNFGTAFYRHEGVQYKYRLHPNSALVFSSFEIKDKQIRLRGENGAILPAAVFMAALCSLEPANARPKYKEWR